MPIEQSLWSIDKTVSALQISKTLTEEQLEEILEKNIAMLAPDWLVIGRQVLTAYGKYIDLLAIDSNGTLIIIELKKGQTSREVVAQGLDYATWVQSLTASQVADVYGDYSNKYLKSTESLDTAFQRKFKSKLEEESVNQSHQIVIVAPELDASTERIINYLNDSLVPINVVFFRIFEHNSQKLISRAWMIDPKETVDRATSQAGEKEPWNGEYYISFGHDAERSWDDALKLGFISGGGGTWYSRTLFQLKVGDRIWVNIPHTGFVGVGRVTETAKPVQESIFGADDKFGNLFDIGVKANYHREAIDDEDRAEYVVQVKWNKAVPMAEAVKEVGFFGNQHTVCKPSTPRWSHTVKRLKEIWNIK
jgi:hypothetical protein